MSEPVLRTTPQRWMTSSIAWLANHLRWQSFRSVSTFAERMLAQSRDRPVLKSENR